VRQALSVSRRACSVQPQQRPDHAELMIGDSPVLEIAGGHAAASDGARAFTANSVSKAVPRRKALIPPPTTPTRPPCVTGPCGADVVPNRYATTRVHPKTGLLEVLRTVAPSPAPCSPPGCPACWGRRRRGGGSRRPSPGSPAGATPGRTGTACCPPGPAAGRRTRTAGRGRVSGCHRRRPPGWRPQGRRRWRPGRGRRTAATPSWRASPFRRLREPCGVEHVTDGAGQFAARVGVQPALRPLLEGQGGRAGPGEPGE
jgi:hypothetical protein